MLPHPKYPRAITVLDVEALLLIPAGPYFIFLFNLSLPKIVHGLYTGSLWEVFVGASWILVRHVVLGSFQCYLPGVLISEFVTLLASMLVPH